MDEPPSKRARYDERDPFETPLHMLPEIPISHQIRFIPVLDLEIVHKGNKHRTRIRELYSVEQLLAHIKDFLSIPYRHHNSLQVEYYDTHFKRYMKVTDLQFLGTKSKLYVATDMPQPRHVSVTWQLNPSTMTTTSTFESVAPLPPALLSNGTSQQQQQQLTVNQQVKVTFVMEGVRTAILKAKSRSALLRNMIKKFCELRGLDQNVVVCKFNGNLLDKTRSLEALGIGDGDSVHVYNAA